MILIIDDRVQCWSLIVHLGRRKWWWGWWWWWWWFAITNVILMNVGINPAFLILAVCRIYFISHTNLEKWPSSLQVSCSLVVRSPNRYLGGHGFYSRLGLRIFFFVPCSCPMFITFIIIFTKVNIHHIHYLSHIIIL